MIWIALRNTYHMSVVSLCESYPRINTNRAHTHICSCAYACTYVSSFTSARRLIVATQLIRIGKRDASMCEAVISDYRATVVCFFFKYDITAIHMLWFDDYFAPSPWNPAETLS